MPKYSPPFTAKSDLPLSSKSLYNERLYYRLVTTEIFNGINPNYIDLWYLTPLYGKVDPRGDFVFPKNEKISYPMSTDPSGNPNIQGFDFALKALEEYMLFLSKAALSGKTGLNRLLNNFKVVSGYVDPFQKYREHLSNILNKFNHYIIQYGLYSKLTNFDKFVCGLLDTMEEVQTSLTFFDFFTSNRTNLTSSGLSFRFLNADQDDDYIKNKFYQHPEFQKYVNTAANFGFRINKNSPWELIVDISSKPMLMNRKIKKPRRPPVILSGYLQEKLITNSQDFFNNYYENVMITSYNYFKELLIFSYNKYVDRIGYTVDYGDPYIIKNKFSNLISDKEFGRTQSQEIDLEYYNNIEYNELYFIRKYERMLNIEFRNSMNKTQYIIFKNNFDNIINKTQSYSRAYSLLDNYYNNLAKIYDPQTKQLLWNSPKNNLTQQIRHGKIQTKDQPTIGKIVTEFLPDI
jgi:hypothetical protein